MPLLRRLTAVVLAAGLGIAGNPPPAQAAFTTSWSNSYGSAGAGTSVQATAVDSSGNVYVGGYMYGATLTLGSTTLTRIGTADAYVAKLNSSGTVVWATNFGGAGATAQPMSIAADSSGNVVVIGTFSGASLTTPALTVVGVTDTFAIKLDSSGTITWSRNYGIKAGTTWGFRVVVDGSSNSYISGYFNTSLISPALTRIGTQDAFVLKLDSAGSTTWARNYGGASATVTAPDIAVDSSGNVYLTGDYNSNLTTPALSVIGTQGAYALKIDSSGTMVWSRAIGGSGARVTAGGIAVDSSGNVHVTGSTETSLTTPALTRVGSTDAYLIKYDSSGTATSVQGFSGAGAAATGSRVGVDSSGNVYVAGILRSADLTTPALTKTGDGDLFVIKVSSAGSVTDSQIYGGASADIGRFYLRLAVESGGSFVVGGTMNQSLSTPSLTKVGTTDGFVLKAGAAATATATFSVTVSGSGTVTSSPSGISCGSTCSASFAVSSTVTLTATAGTGAAFSGWSGLCSGTNSSYAYTIQKNNSGGCTATFTAASTTGGTETSTPPTWLGPTGTGELTFSSVEVTVGADGSVNASVPAGNFNAADLTFTASQSDGSALPSWLTFDPVTLTFSGTPPATTPMPRQRPVVAKDAQSSAGRWLATEAPRVVVRLTISLRVSDRLGRAATITFPFVAYATRTQAAIVAVSVTDAATPGNGTSTVPAISDDGGAVVFLTSASNLVADIPISQDVLRYDSASGKLDRFSTGSFMGTISGSANGWSGAAAISADAGAIAFASDAPNIGLPWGNGFRQVWVADATLARVSNATPSPTAASAAADGTLGDGTSDNPALSEDGRYVAFESEATNLVAGTSGGTRRIYRKDRTTGDIALVGTGRRASISADGRYVAFDDGTTVFRKDMTGGTAVTVGTGTTPRMNRDGRYIAYQSGGRILRADLSAGTTSVVASEGGSPAISGDGRFVAFSDQNQIYAHDAVAGTTALVSTNAEGAGGNGASSDPAISGNGRYIAFASQATDLVAGQSAGQLYLAGNPLTPPIASGWWWDPSQAGSGFAIETSGDRLMLGAFLYATDGTPTWYMGQGTVSSTAWSAPIEVYAGGQTLTGDHRAAALTGTMGTGALAISARIAAVLSGAHAAGLQRYDFVAGGSSAGAKLGSPESGWWWNPEEPGTGWHLEIQNSSLFLAGFVYDERGQASWVSSSGVMTSTRAYSGTLTRCSGGQTLGGAYQPPTCAGSSDAIAIAFTSPIAATMTLPSGRKVSLKRFRF